MFRRPPLATSNLRGVHSRKQPRAGKQSSKTRNRQGELTRSEGGKACSFPNLKPAKERAGSKTPGTSKPTKKPTNPPNTESTYFHNTDGRPKEGGKLRYGGGWSFREEEGTCGHPPGGAGEAPRQLRRQRWAKKAGPGGATGPISAPAPSVNSPYRLPDRPFGPLIRLQARPLRLPSAFLCPPLHSRSSLPRPRPPQEGVGLRLRVFRLRGWEMMIWCFDSSVLPLFLVLG